MIFLSQGKILDIIDNKEDGIIQINIDTVYQYNDSIKSNISHIEIKNKNTDKTFSIDKLHKWKKDGTVLAFIHPEISNSPICIYDGREYHPVSKQKSIPLSFFKKTLFKGYETIFRMTGFGFSLALLFTLLLSHPLNLHVVHFVLSFTMLFSGFGLIYNINNWVNFWEMKKLIKKEFNPEIFKEHSTSISLSDIFRRNFIFSKGKSIKQNDIIKAINLSDLNPTDKIQLQNKLPAKGDISFKDLIKIQREYFSKIEK